MEQIHIEYIDNEQINNTAWQTFKNTISDNLTSIKIGLVVASLLFLYYVYLSSTASKFNQCGGSAVGTVARGVGKGALLGAKGTGAILRGVGKGALLTAKGTGAILGGVGKGALLTAKGTGAILGGVGKVTGGVGKGMQFGTRKLGSGIDGFKSGMSKIGSTNFISKGFGLVFQFVSAFMMLFGIVMILILIPTIPILFFFVISYYICRRKIWALRTL